jgi:tetratricopeptide (TPR) repeat protein
LVWFNPLDPKFAVSLAAVVAISALLFWRRREWPGTLALWLCHLVLLVPVLGLTEHPHFANDRYSYLVAIPVSAAVAILLVQFGKRPLWRVLALAGAAAAIALCGKASAAQVGIWRDSGTLFHYMLSKLGPDPYRADILVRLGRLDRDEGRQAEAVAAFQEAVRAEPNWSMAHYELGSTLVHAGEPERGISELQETLRIEPGMLEALDDLAGALFSAGRVPESIAAMKEVLRTAPSAVAYYDLSVMYGREGRFEEAVRACDEALRLDPNDIRTLALKKALVGAKEK